MSPKDQVARAINTLVAQAGGPGSDGAQEFTKLRELHTALSGIRNGRIATLSLDEAKP